MTIIYKNPTVIAEIGCNHKGNIDIAKDMIQIASNCGASYVNLKRDNKYLLKEKYYKPHPLKKIYGKTYGLHREFLEFNMKQHYDLYRYCLKKIKYAVSVCKKIQH